MTQHMYSDFKANRVSVRRYLTEQSGLHPTRRQP